MQFLKQLAALLTPKARSTSSVYWVYVQCHRCGEVLRGRVNLLNDLSIRYEDVDGYSGYYVRKVLVGEANCFQRIEVELEFDTQRRLKNREITGGKFVTEDVYNDSIGSLPVEN